MTPVQNSVNGTLGGAGGLVNGVDGCTFNGMYGGNSDLANGFQHSVRDNEKLLLTWMGSINLGLSLLLSVDFLSSSRKTRLQVKRSGKC